MISAVDTSIVLDVIRADEHFGQGSARVLRQAHSVGALVACEVVWAEVASEFGDAESLSRTMERLRLIYSAMDAPSASLAGVIFQRYRRTGGPRERVIADFLIGAHASQQADRLLTRDRGFYRTYFKSLAIVAPS